MSDHSLAGRIRAERIRRKLTQDELAREAGVSVPTVVRAENGRAPESGPAVQRLATHLGLIGDAGHSPSGAPLASAKNSGTVPTMAEMLGRLQIPASALDPYSALVELAVERDDPALVFQTLARARKEAPRDADLVWWLRVYFSALDAARDRSSPATKPRRT